VVDDRLAPVRGLRKGNGVRSALPYTHAAADAGVLVDGRLAVAVHFPLAGGGAAPHAQVLQRPADAGALVAFEVRQADDRLRVHHGAADEGVVAVLAPDGNAHEIRAQQAVRDDHVAARLQRREAVEVRGVDVVQRVSAHAGVQGVAVGQKRARAHPLQLVHHGSGVVGPQEGEVARLAKVNFDRGKLARKRHVRHAGPAHQAVQLVRKAQVGRGAKIGEVNLGFLHRLMPLPDPVWDEYTIVF
jgi:hypothetical protein